MLYIISAIFIFLFSYLSLEMPILFGHHMANQNQKMNNEACPDSLDEYLADSEEHCLPPKIDYYSNDRSHVIAPPAICLLLPPLTSNGSPDTIDPPSTTDVTSIDDASELTPARRASGTSGANSITPGDLTHKWVIAHNGRNFTCN